MPSIGVHLNNISATNSNVYYGNINKKTALYFCHSNLWRVMVTILHRSSDRSVAINSFGNLGSLTNIHSPQPLLFRSQRVTFIIWSIQENSNKMVLLADTIISPSGHPFYGQIYLAIYL